ncbi:hypothetical protein ENSA5_12180 [Enhygromyxa salina]|uniref:Uncharacterized protein n=1 Tax=Enhygromyxa salina TaxID=215803 RepID=A0A2S9YFI6_9BACT|nr:hypothetical protein ENSA5_12180 [Enhygromyxa salina]
MAVCTCTDLAQAQSIRASLEARGVPTLVDGEHQRNVMGMFGTVVDLRIMVPRSQLRLAHALASEIIEDLPPLELDDEEPESSVREASPLRRPMPEDLLPPEDEAEADEYEYEDEDEDEESEEENDRQLARMRDRNTLMWRRLLVGGWTAMALLRFVFTGSLVALVSLAVLAALVYWRVLPLTPALEGGAERG